MNKMFGLIMMVCISSVQAMDIKHELGQVQLDKPPKKVIALDWALTETVLSLGVNPIGVADVQGYQSWVKKPELNDSVMDVGSRREPNLELITELKPDVILISQHMSPIYGKLNAIAPTLVYTVYSNKKAPLVSAKEITIQLGNLLNKKQQAQDVIAKTDQRLKENGDKIRRLQLNNKPLLFIRFINDKTVRVHSDGSLAQATINQMGLVNAWHEATNMWGFTTAGFEALAQHQESNVLIFGPLKETEKKQLTQSALWQAMTFSRTDSVYELPAIWTFGGLISAQRFSDNITQQLTQ
ncbi:MULTISPECIES: iron-siderophore ABC transporter substrate-binding protein [Aliivibrio]|uniref:Iron-siderophore ABC transporter substrate-binding protein n=1 Tax=Aliivibrio finisterrensis TaxID=511998 RepID=A0A4Q5KYA8_9GAMM|nr:MULTISPECIES: iron-siderophore ABC transporter substrate-binding protein [Aliivibrio]MDD9180435.1 iron-siderophore ABC transporter substrate-binding protein [Aliivibrio sp. A6]RYU54842.1 iron-siderophore ABC transporter substrate-binding protein [Aliivibrio finisterrensis]RYU56517.1 iron-siderophore ABC transporter substrate-binding protein [Aliivibrio finisterrensis]RYU61638.1 iron-siderophore ABC transporter substrate-binding protein [Aliivibrio finisterrensis]RYU66773.1 iron-siderophore 